MWIMSEKQDLAISCVPKCASTTIRRAFNYPDAKVVNSDQAIECNRRIAFLKHFMERLVSCFFFFKEKNESGLHKQEPKIEITKHWELFVDHILLKPNNPHWAPQVKQLSLNGKYIATETYTVDQIDAYLGSFVKGLIKHLNASKKSDVNQNYRLEDLKQLYRKDIELLAEL